MLKRVLSLAALVACSIVYAETFRIEAENFAIRQGKAQIGKHAYAYSNGQMALTTAKETVLGGIYRLDQAGKYQVWIRTFTQGEKWRNGELSINGQALGIFGDEALKEGGKDHWHWVKLTPIDLPAGKCEFKILSPKGYVRVDAIILTDDEAYIPPEIPADIGKVPTLPSDSADAADTAIPSKSSDDGKAILLFNGGRPWQANAITKLLTGYGFQVETISGQRLNGLSGASFEDFITDKPTKAPIDGITPAFAKLSPATFKLVVFHQIPPENMPKVLTAENTAKLKEYAENGGNALFTYDMPAGLAEELMPVTLNKSMVIEEPYSANRPASENYAFFPETLPVLGTFLLATAKSGTEVLSMIKDPGGKEVAPYLARTRLGKGSVTFFNAHKINPKQFQDFANWAYNAPFFAQVVADCIGVKIEPKMPAFQEIPARPQLSEVKLTVAEPVLSIADESKEPVLYGRRALFGNGMVLAISAEGTVSALFPDIDQSIIRNAETPKIVVSPHQRVLDSQTAEAVDVKESSQTLQIDWRFTDAQVQGNEVLITYTDTSGQNVMVRHFKAGKMNLDGRIYPGLAEKTELVKSPFLVSGIDSQFELDLPDPLFARRFDCYQPPRGYRDFDLTGQATTLVKGGQPFKLIACKNGVYLSYSTDIGSSGGTITRQKGAPFIQTSLTTKLGRVFAPVSTSWQWRYFSAGPERGHQEYLAMYQFYRKLVRQLYGLKEMPACPVVRYDYQLSQSEKETVIQAAVKAGYRYVSPPNPESPIESINSEGNKKIYDWISGMGAFSRIWTAGSYAQGNNGWLINNHPEWFVRDEKGEIFQYFRKYPVLDINNTEFRKWCQGVYQDAIDHGVRWFYRDMDGAAAGNVNYGLKQSPWAGHAQAEMYKFFHDNGARVGVEGMNPLVLDEFWYRASLYTPFAGQEFALVGMQPNGDILGGLGLDPMRTGMYGCFMMYEYSGTAFNFDRVLGEAERGRRSAALAPKFHEALAFVGMPYIRESEFGTVWYGKGGAVMFFWNPVEKLTLDLPAGWKIRGTEGSTIANVPCDSIIYIDRK